MLFGEVNGICRSFEVFHSASFIMLLPRLENCYPEGYTFSNVKSNQRYTFWQFHLSNCVVFGMFGVGGEHVCCSYWKRQILAFWPHNYRKLYKASCFY